MYQGKVVKTLKSGNGSTSFGVTSGMIEIAKFDPTLVCTAFKKNRFYLFSKREPMETGAKEIGRDIYNENTSKG